VTRLPRRATLLAAFYLLTSVTSATAECAWVLWTTSFKLSGGTPIHSIIDPSDAYPTKGECDRALQRRDEREDERRKKDPTTERYFACFPDTVDPRAPKGK